MGQKWVPQVAGATKVHRHSRLIYCRQPHADDLSRSRLFITSGWGVFIYIACGSHIGSSVKLGGTDPLTWLCPPRWLAGVSEVPPLLTWTEEGCPLLRERRRKCDRSYIHVYREGEYRYIHRLSAVKLWTSIAVQGASKSLRNYGKFCRTVFAVDGEFR